jgi:hypothetical protein
MIEFFEFLNGCSPLRATAYMAFILIFLYIIGLIIETIFDTLFNRGSKTPIVKDGVKDLLGD